MTLFAILGIPCLTLFLVSVDTQSGIGIKVSPARGRLAVQFLKGFFYAVPCLVAVLLLRRYVPLSYRAFPLYLYFLFSDHLVPLIFLGVLYFLAYARKSYSELLLFGGGFLTLLGLVEILTHYGEYEIYHLFLLPAIRMGALLFLTIFFRRYQEWYGTLRVLFLILLVIIPFLSAGLTHLYMRAHTLWAVLGVAAFFLGSLVYTFLERTR
jgi:hypothetical protein